MYKRNRDLIGGINSAISGVGGKMKVNSLFENGSKQRFIELIHTHVHEQVQ